MTVQQIFDMAIHLMDEQSERSGETLTVDTQEYKFRTISILNNIIPVLYPYSDTYDKSGKGRPVPPLLDLGKSYREPDLAQEIGLDDTISAALLPLYLAAQLIFPENEGMAQWFMSRYQMAFMDVRSKIPAEFETIYAPYGLF